MVVVAKWIRGEWKKEVVEMSLGGEEEEEKEKVEEAVVVAAAAASRV